MEQNTSKNRKSEAQERFEEADNAGRFAGDDADAQAARRLASDNITEDAQSSREERDNSEAGRNVTKTQDYKGEAQNVNDDTGRPMNEEEAEKARNKATEGLRQGRNNS